MTALLLGEEPPCPLGYTYTTAPPYDAVVIGSMKLSEMMHFSNEAALCALAEGKTVIIYTPGLPTAPKNRALAAALSSRRREMMSWGAVLTDGQQKRLVTASAARAMRASGQRPAPGAVLTPLAKEILEGMQ